MIHPTPTNGRDIAKHSVLASSGDKFLQYIAEFADMSSEMNRLITFLSWSNNDAAPTLLVSAGFYFTKLNDTTKCFSCNNEVSNWKKDMHPDVVHRTRFPDCLLVRGEETRHKPMQPEPIAFEENFFTKDSNDKPFISRNPLIVKQSINSHGMTTPELVVPAKPRLSSSLAYSTGLLSPAPIAYSDMRFEQARLNSFSNWPKRGIVQASDIARAGMYFIGPGDRVECIFCKGKLEGWVRGDNPLQEHRKHFGSRCLFLQGASVGNIPIVQGDNTSPPPSSSSTVNANEASSLRYPAFTSLGKRLESFRNWTSTTQGSIDLASAGFFFENVGDTVKCYSCGGSLNDWEPIDDPWIEHARWFQDCSHVIQVKGPDFVRTALGHNGARVRTVGSGSSGSSTVPVGSIPQSTSGLASGNSVEAIMASPAAVTVLEMGLTRSDVEQAARAWTTNNHGRMPDANSLAELAMSIKDGDGSSSPHGVSGLTSSNYNVTLPATNNTPAPPAAADSPPPTKSKHSKKKKKNKSKIDPVQQKPAETEDANPSKTLENEDPSMDEKATKVMREFNDLQEQRLCKVCLDEEINMVFLPCGHLVCCAMCAPALSKCPICRSPITDTVRTYLA